MATQRNRVFMVLYVFWYLFRKQKPLKGRWLDVQGELHWAADKTRDWGSARRSQLHVPFTAICSLSRAHPVSVQGLEMKWDTVPAASRNRRGTISILHRLNLFTTSSFAPCLCHLSELHESSAFVGVVPPSCSLCSADQLLFGEKGVCFHKVLFWSSLSKSEFNWILCCRTSHIFPCLPRSGFSLSGNHPRISAPRILSLERPESEQPQLGHLAFSLKAEKKNSA